jgi:glycosyltransferase involved in cell wall biosynthesis
MEGSFLINDPFTSALTGTNIAKTFRRAWLGEKKHMAVKEDALLSPEVSSQIGRVGKADILVGIPSFNNANTIGHVVKAVSAGLAKHFSDFNAVIVNSDGGSTDGTREVVANTEIASLDSLMIRHRLHPVHKISTPYHGIPGKGSAFRTIFKIAQLLGARACAVVDSDLRSITPEWIEMLIGPVLNKNYDYVAPLYRRHKYDGTITNSIVYPMSRALYGKRIRQPIGGDFGFSGELASRYLSKDVWDTNVARYGIDIWMTTTALAEGFKVCQSFLGAKIHDPKDPGSDLSAMLIQVVSSVFELMDTYANVWDKVEGSEVVPYFGFEYSVGLEPINVNTQRMVDNFRQGAQDLTPIWAEILQPSNLSRLQSLAAQETHAFPDDLWADVIYDFAHAYHRRAMNRDHLIGSLTPLYLGRTAAFVMETTDANSDEVEERIESLALAYEAAKKPFVERWKKG